jgi:hypothetical protein
VVFYAKLISNVKSETEFHRAYKRARYECTEGSVLLVVEMSRELTPYEKALQLTQQSIKRASYNAHYNKLKF